MELFGSSGTRGVAGEQLTPAFVLDMARVVGAVWEGERVAVARDTRLTGPMFANAASAGLAAAGVDVDRLGVLPTPGAQAYAREEGIPVVVITASHNPPEYNGVKLITDDGIEATVEQLEGIESRYLADATPTKGWNETGTERHVEGVNRRYVDGVLDAIDRDTIEEADLTVALDTGHGAASGTSPELLRRLGCRVVTVNANVDGTFPGRDPEPVESNLGDLAALVRASDADVGIAHDGDGDRSIFFDETGSYVEGDAALAALANAELEPGDASVAAVNVSQRLVDVCAERDVDLELTPIGSTYITTRIRELQAEGRSVPIAGEGNGGIYFPPYALARDGAYIAGRFLELLAERPASDLLAPFDGYRNVRRKLAYASEREREAMLAAIDRETEREEAERTTIDGIRLDYGDAWVLARPSGTEPIVRVYAEGRERERAEELAARLIDAAENARAEV